VKTLVCNPSPSSFFGLFAFSTFSQSARSAADHFE
jgi:hypothetical protein